MSRRVLDIRALRAVLFGGAGAILLAAGWTGAAGQPASAPERRHVVIISLDGYSEADLNDSGVPAPNLRRLIREGVASEGMTAVNPTVTWPNHTTMVTGVGPDRHGVLFNGLPVRAPSGPVVKVEPRVPKERLVLAPTLYDLAHRAGRTTAEVDWVAIENAPTITWSFSEWPRLDGTVEREMMKAGLVTDDELKEWSQRQITFKDEVWTRAAEHIITTHRPDLLLVHLLTTDSVQHRYGPHALAAHTALELADARVGRIVEACKAAGILSRTTFFVVSDHGFTPHRRLLRPNAWLAHKGLNDAAWVISEGGTAMVYLARDGLARASEVKTALGQLEGIARVITPEEMPALGYPTPATSDRMANFVLAAADGIAFDGSPAAGEPAYDVLAGSTPGSHGYLNTDPAMRAIFIVSGSGVKKGGRLGLVRSLDVGPTAARLLGLEMPNVQGRVLTEALEGG